MPPCFFSRNINNVKLTYTVQDNGALYDGGAIYINNSNLDLNLYSNVFSYNRVLWGTGSAVYNCGDYVEIIYNCWDDGSVDFEHDGILVKRGSPDDIYYADSDIRIDPSQEDLEYPFAFLQREINSYETFTLTRDYAYIEKFDKNM